MAELHFKNGWARKWQEYEDEIIREHYPVNGWEKVHSFLPNRSREQIRARASKIGVSYLKYNRDFFEIIDTEEKAYWLGFVYADGYVTTENRFGIELGIKDLSHLEKFTKSLEYNGKIRSRIRNGNETCLILIKNGKVFKDLEDKGVFRDKTYSSEFPSDKQVPPNLVNHFLRGYFDGDGCYHFNRRKVPRKDRGWKIYNKLSKEISLTCKSEKMINEIRAQLLSQGIESRIDINPKGDLPVLRISNIENMVKLINYLYKNATLYLDRKKDKANEILGYSLSYQ